MSPKEARNAMVQAFIDGSSLPDSLIALDNQKFDPPEDQTSWARIAIQHNDGEQAALGAPPNQYFRRFGFVAIQHFVRIDDATNNLDDLCYESLQIFEGQHIQTIWFRNGRIVYVPVQEEKWYQQNVLVEFIYDDIH